MSAAAAYVYAVLVEGETRYIGKGRGDRSGDHLKMVRSIVRRRAAGETVKVSLFYRKLTARWLEGCEIEVVVLEDGLTDEAAYEREAAIIASFSADQLWNTDAGGRGRTSCSLKRQWSAPEATEARQQARERMAGHHHRMIEASRDACAMPEERARKSAATKRQHAAMSPEARAARVAKIKVSRQAEWQSGTLARVLAYIGQKPGCTRGEIKNALAPPSSAFKVALCALQKREQIVKCEGQFYRTGKPSLLAVNSKEK